MTYSETIVELANALYPDFVWDARFDLGAGGILIAGKISAGSDAAVVRTMGHAQLVDTFNRFAHAKALVDEIAATLVRPLPWLYLGYVDPSARTPYERVADG